MGRRKGSTNKATKERRELIERRFNIQKRMTTEDSPYEGGDGSINVEYLVEERDARAADPEGGDEIEPEERAEKRQKVEEDREKKIRNFANLTRDIRESLAAPEIGQKRERNEEKVELDEEMNGIRKKIEQYYKYFPDKIQARRDLLTRKWKLEDIQAEHDRCKRALITFDPVEMVENALFSSIESIEPLFVNRGVRIEGLADDLKQREVFHDTLVQLVIEKDFLSTKILNTAPELKLLAIIGFTGWQLHSKRSLDGKIQDELQKKCPRNPGDFNKVIAEFQSQVKVENESE